MNKKKLKVVEAKLAEKAEELLALGEVAEDEGRELTDEEKKTRESLRAEITSLKERAEALRGEVEVDEEIQTLARGLGGDVEARDRSAGREREKQNGTLGEQFVESDGFKKLIDNGLTGKWSTGDIDLKPAAANFFEGTGASPGVGGALVPEDRRPGVLPILYERLTVADLLAAGSTTSNLVRYVEETVADDSAVGTVAEGADKPEVALELDLVDEPVRKIAAFLPVSDEMLEDAAQIRSYIDARLGLFVRIEEENQSRSRGGPTSSPTASSSIPTTGPALSVSRTTKGVISVTVPSAGCRATSSGVSASSSPRRLPPGRHSSAHSAPRRRCSVAAVSPSRRAIRTQTSSRRI
jgi:HK97 family phage major capsid protein